MKKVFIIILNWKNWPDTIECVESLEKIDYSDFKIVVIDNESNKESVSNFAGKFPEIKIIENPINSGYAGGNNLGIKYSLKNRADYVLLLNNDTVVDKDFLRLLIETGENNEKAGLLGPSIYFFNQPDKIWFLGGRFRWLKTRWTKGRVHLGFDIPVKDSFKQEVQKVDFITGCACLIKKEVFKKIGYLDERLFIYYEDMDFNLRARKAGYSCLVVPDSKIWHKISISVNKLGSPKILQYHYRNALLLTKKNAPFLIDLLKHIWAGLILTKQILKILFFPSKREKSSAIIKGIFDYYQKKFGQIR